MANSDLQKCEGLKGMEVLPDSLIPESCISLSHFRKNLSFFLSLFLFHIFVFIFIYLFFERKAGKKFLLRLSSVSLFQVSAGVPAR